jgi:hypothetical protein
MTHPAREFLAPTFDGPTFDRFATVPRESGQTNIREVLVTRDHTASHVGQIVLVRHLLDAWK